MEKTDLKPLSPIPVSKGHWLLKNLPAMRKGLLPYFSHQMKVLGTTFRADVPFLKIVATSDPEFIRYVLQGNQRNFAKGRSYQYLKLILGNGLVTSNGDFWQRQRRLAQPAFYKKNLEDLFEQMGLVAKEYFDELEQQRGNEIDITREMMGLTSKIVLKALFSDNQEEDLNKVHDSVDRLQHYIIQVIGNPFYFITDRLNGKYGQYEKDKKILDNVVLNAIARRRKSGEKHPDLLQMMMDATFEDSNEQMNDEQLRDEMVTMFSAGHETSANGLAFTLRLLAQHPEIVAKMRTEIKEVIGDKLPGFQDLRRLTYVRQVIDESLRLYPPAWSLSRVALEDDEYRGIKIAKGTNVYLMIYNTHHRESLWENAEQFNPDRFSPEKVKEMQKMTYLPFGGGPRQCIGNMFALMEMQLVLTGMVQRFDFELLSEEMELEGLVTLRTKEGIRVRVK